MAPVLGFFPQELQEPTPAAHCTQGKEKAQNKP